jgi:lysophospholipase L1-like esterase
VSVTSRLAVRAAIAAIAGVVVVAGSGEASAQVRYVAFGDSITAGVGDESPTYGGEGYTRRLQDLLRSRGINAFVDNFGKGGEDTVEGLGRIDSALSGGGDALLLMEGTNDITTNIGPETTLQNLVLMAQKADKRRMRVVHATTIPRLPNVTVDYRNILSQRLAEGLRDEAGSNGRDLADPFAVFSAQGSLFSRLYARLDNDPVGHPNAAGYDLLAGVFADVETDRDLVPPVPGLTTPPTGSRDVAPGAELVMDVWDFGTEPEASSLVLTINGVDVVPTRVGEGRLIQLRYRPPTPWAGVVRVALKGRDRTSPPNETSRESLRFVVQGVQLLTGDLDQDGRVDGEDLVTFALHFGARRNQPGRYLATADFDNDGEINGVDLATLAANFGRSAG